MKSYWIVAAAFSVGWPSGSTAYVGMDQAKQDEKPVQQTQTANSSTPAKPATAIAQSKSSYLLVELSKSLKAKKLKPGDKIKAQVSQDVISHNKVIIPVETELVGHVTEVSVRNGNNSESRLGIVFDKMLLKHYHDVNLQAVVQAVAPPVQRKSRVDEPSQMLPPSMITGSLRQSSPGPVGRSTGPSIGRGAVAPGQSNTISDSSSVNFQAPLTVKQSPSTHVGTGGAAAQLGTSPQTGQAMSVGTPQGITGLKGLSLTAGTTTS
ncbi:MAG TPA: hypothetical protein VE133_08105, partial [Candidatus Sulfotelmatobacter sp.]|nr:hypothetical protein [Candidatus Sulfotelmatobacter sp.]